MSDSRDQRDRSQRDPWRDVSGRRDGMAGRAPRSQPRDRLDPRDELRQTLLPELTELIERPRRRSSADGADDATAEFTRRLSDDERRAILRRHREQEPGDDTLPPPPVRIPRDRPGGRTVTLGAILVVGILAVTLGAGGIFNSNGAGSPAPTPTQPPVVVALGSPAAADADGNASPESALTGDPAWPGQGDGQTVVCLDPGHGGWDQGYSRVFTGPLPAMSEADYNLAQAYDLADRLTARGYEVVMTRRSPSAVNADGRDVNGDGETIADSARAGVLDELQARIDICNAAAADLLVSMHINGFDTRPLVQGYETWYTGSRPFGDLSERFATLVFRALGEEMVDAGFETAAREVNDDSRISVDDSDKTLLNHMVITGPDVRGVIDASEMPGALVEALFISNDADAAFLSSPEGHDAIVSAYESAIVDYFDEIES